MIGLASGFAALAVVASARSRPDPDALFRRARGELAAGEATRASETVARLERLRPPTPFDRLLRAQVAEAADRLADASAELSRIEDRHPLAPVARLLAGQVEMKRGRLGRAEAAFLATLAIEPGSAKPRLELAHLYDLQHRLRERDEQLHILSGLDLLEYDFLVHWTTTHQIPWSLGKEAKVLSRAVEADPNDRQSRLALAEGLLRMNEPQEALDALAPLADSDPEARPIRALIAIDRGDDEGLEPLLSGAPADDPRLAAFRGRLALKEGRPAEAVGHFRLALGVDPDDRSTLLGLGNALRQAGDPSAAERYFEATRRHDAITSLIADAATPAGKLDPTLPARIASACEAAGRMLEASAWYRLAVAHDPLDGKSQEGLARVAPAAQHLTASPIRPHPGD